MNKMVNFRWVLLCYDVKGDVENFKVWFSFCMYGEILFFVLYIFLVNFVVVVYCRFVDVVEFLGLGDWDWWFGCCCFFCCVCFR